MADEIELREALQGMVEQFAHRTFKDGKRAFSTGGLSALEQAFGVLGWNDPHVVGDADSVGCEIAGCRDWAECVGPYPRSRAKLGAPPSMIGFGYLCTNHYFSWSGPDAVPADDLGRVPTSC